MVVWHVSFLGCIECYYFYYFYFFFLLSIFLLLWYGPLVWLQLSLVMCWGQWAATTALLRQCAVCAGVPSCWKMKPPGSSVLHSATRLGSKLSILLGIYLRRNAHRPRLWYEAQTWSSRSAGDFCWRSPYFQRPHTIVFFRDIRNSVDNSLIIWKFMPWIWS